LPTDEKWDVAVVGVGTMGSMALWRLAQRGARVVGIERFEVGHSFGAAGGETRIFRTAYKEGREYVPLLRRSRRLWAELQASSGTELLTPTGALTIGSPDHPELREVLAGAEEHGLRLDVLETGEARSRFPQHRFRDGEVAVLDPDGGLLRPTQAIRAAVAEAVGGGAEVLSPVQVRGVRDTGSGVEVDLGDRILRADHAIVCLGPWTQSLMPQVGRRFEVRRSVLHWFAVDNPSSFAPELFPVGLRRSGPEANLSFFPCMDGRTIKVNLHAPRQAVSDPDRFDRQVSNDYSDYVASRVAPLFNGLHPNPVRGAAYMEGYSPDNHALIGSTAAMPGLTILAAFSGHGFKLSPLVGEVAADLALEGRTDHHIDHMSMTRPGPYAPSSASADALTARSTTA
jgi:sarcosine oxidase